MPSWTHYPFVCTAINMGERSVSREDRKQHPSAFRATESQWLISTWSELNQGQCALFDFIELTIVLQRGTAWTMRSYSLLVFLCDIPWFFFHRLQRKDKSEMRMLEADWAGGQKRGGALRVESGRSTDLSTDGAVCNSSCEIKNKTAQLLLKLISIPYWALMQRLHTLI